MAFIKVNLNDISDVEGNSLRLTVSIDDIHFTVKGTSELDCKIAMATELENYLKHMQERIDTINSYFYLLHSDETRTISPKGDKDNC